MYHGIRRLSQKSCVHRVHRTTTVAADSDFHHLRCKIILFFTLLCNLIATSPSLSIFPLLKQLLANFYLCKLGFLRLFLIKIGVFHLRHFLFPSSIYPLLSHCYLDSISILQQWHHQFLMLNRPIFLHKNLSNHFSIKSLRN